jgi:hypothetical protein
VVDYLNNIGTYQNNGMYVHAWVIFDVAATQKEKCGKKC